MSRGGGIAPPLWVSESSELAIKEARSIENSPILASMALTSLLLVEGGSPLGTLPPPALTASGFHQSEI